jgi:hypothetical protein
MATAKKVVATKKPATHKVAKAVNATAERTKQLQASATMLVNAHNAADVAGDAVSSARKDYYAQCKQSFGASFFKADKSILNQPRVIFYKAHFESKALAVNVSVNAARGEVKSDAVDATQADAVKREADNAKSRFNKFLAWCVDEAAGKHAEKNANNRQSNAKGKRTIEEIVQDAGQRMYNAMFKAGNKVACTELQAWATKHCKGVKFAVPAGK